MFQFCNLHKDEPTPVILAKSMSQASRDRLHAARKSAQKSNLKLPKDQVFVMESVLDKRISRGKIQYKGNQIRIF